MKRFQQLQLDHRWVKSQKIVRFPLNDFDPNHYIAPRQPGYYKQFLENNKTFSSKTDDKNKINGAIDDHDVFAMTVDEDADETMNLTNGHGESGKFIDEAYDFHIY